MLVGRKFAYEQRGYQSLLIDKAGQSYSCAINTNIKALALMHAFVFERTIPIGRLATVETLKGGFQAIDTSSLLVARLTES